MPYSSVLCTTFTNFAVLHFKAALGPMLMNSVVDLTLVKHGETILMVSVLSIMLTAPTAAILITITGPRLLTKTTVPHVPEGWRRSHRPSIRDISIIDEEEERDDNVEAGDTTSNKEISKSIP